MSTNSALGSAVSFITVELCFPRSTDINTGSVQVSANVAMKLPKRTHEAIQHGFHKRRHAIKCYMENQAAEAASSNTAGLNKDAV
ncbi:hypothetical protein FVEN_g4524 [Fusarium venenatum]|uniref:Uncharacterized protein n=1 Tax=Fusarium venenatum TaxID=56646 RepID=A0A2L2T5I9_9HYPO|nr:uncharacterized protein FVRRES_02576 [Fusarium venenatum]KAG8357913.1 hypothetical protein FVEN_g4524 [Fusarium venenatum]KAH7004328.1 hypothetical protein EDB82DRAFT_46261 [Fusarium venenatum]CEI66064.1 unnamed protein product [Fusarium venenatum]